MKYYQIRQICNQKYLNDASDALFDEKNIIYAKEKDVLKELKRILDEEIYFNDDVDISKNPSFDIPPIEKVKECSDFIEIYNDNCLIIWINVLKSVE
jgi:hypothetical protein